MASEVAVELDVLATNAENLDPSVSKANNNYYDHGHNVLNFKN